MFGFMETVHVNTAQHIGIDYPVAGIGERMASRLIDLSMFAVGLFVVMFTGAAGATWGSNVVAYVAFILFIASYVFYNLICELFMNGQSVGKRMMKIKVISLDGGQPTLGQYLLRWLFRVVDFTLTAQVGGLICIALSQNKQRIGDIVAGTTVIKTVKRTGIEQIAFLPGEGEDYTPVFQQVIELNDREVELIHEVISTYYKTRNAAIVYAMAAKISSRLKVNLPEGMNEFQFLQTVVKDYSHITAGEHQS